MTDAEKAAATVEALRSVLGDGATDDRDPARVLSMVRTVVATYYPPHDPNVIDIGGGMTMRLADDPARRPPPGAMAVFTQLDDEPSR